MGRPTIGGSGGGRPNLGGHNVSRPSGGHNVSRPSGGHNMGSSRPSMNNRANTSTSRPNMNTSRQTPSPKKQSFTTPPPPPPKKQSFTPPPPPPRRTNFSSPPPPPTPHMTRGTVIRGPVIINNQGNTAERHYQKRNKDYGDYSERTYIKQEDTMESLEKKSGNLIRNMIIAAICFIAVILAVGCFVKPANDTKEKLAASEPFVEDCVIDELGWIDSMSKDGLRHFYDETGIQPFIYLKAYDASLTTKQAKEEWTVDYYEKNIPNETSFLYVYFEDEDPNVIGYMTYAGGTGIQTVMDAEAVSVFWDNIDTYWDMISDTGELFNEVFESTADEVMQDMSGFAKPFLMTILIAGFIVVEIVFTCSFVGIKKRKDRLKEEENRKILDTPMEELVDQHLEDLKKEYDE